MWSSLGVLCRRSACLRRSNKNRPVPGTVPHTALEVGRQSAPSILTGLAGRFAIKLFHELGRTCGGLTVRLEFSGRRTRDALSVGEFHGESQGLISKRPRSTATILDLHNEVVLVLSKPDHISPLIHDHKQQCLSTGCSHLSDERAGAPVSSHEGPGFGDHTTLPCWPREPILQSAGINSSHRHDVAWC